MGGIVVFVNLAVFYRYVLADPLTWTNEISSYLLVFSVLFGASIALKHKQFVKVEAFSNLLPSQVRSVVMMVSQLLIAAFLVVCIDSPSLLIQKAIITKTISPALGIPMVQLYRLLRVGFAFMLFFVSITTIESFMDREMTKDVQGTDR
jgi:TRAP-type C4-dicarboxylate transport system permease small subunit